MRLSLMWTVTIWIFFASAVCSAKNLTNDLFDWSYKFHGVYFDMSNDLPGHEAHVDGYTSNGEKCRLETFKEGSGLSITLRLMEAKDVNVGVDVTYGQQSLYRLDIDKGNLNLQGGREFLSIQGDEIGRVEEAKGTSPKSPKGITCYFRPPVSS